MPVVAHFLDLRSFIINNKGKLREKALKLPLLWILRPNAQELAALESPMNFSENPCKQG